MSRTILIAPAETIAVLRQQPYLHESEVFADTDTELALDQIRHEVPTVIAVERLFAASEPGHRFLNKIKSDANLAGCQIQIVGVRQSPRHKVNETVFLDGTAATMLDISATGAHVVCPAPLKPTQRLHLSLRPHGHPLTAFAVWVEYELPKEGPRYRAGIEFAASAAASVADYISELSPLPPM